MGLENGLSNCIRSDVNGNNCDQSMIAGAICSNGEVPQMTLRLYNSDSSDQFEGRLQVMFAGVWGEICFSNWGMEEGSVACHQLGFKSYTESYGVSRPPDSMVWLNNEVKCNGSESSIAYCEYDEVGLQSCVTSVWLKCSANTSNSVLRTLSTLSEIPIACTCMTHSCHFSGFMLFLFLTFSIFSKCRRYREYWVVL